MPGIRISTPVGPDWEYSLDQQNWQTDTLFEQAPEGVAFVVDQPYLVYCRYGGDQIVTGEITFGEATNEENLDDVMQRLDLSVEQYEADGVLSTIFQRGKSWIARRMTWSRIAAYIAVMMTADYLLYFAQRLAQYTRLNDVLSNGNEAAHNVILTGNNHLITKQLPGEPVSDRGHYHIIRAADGTETIASFAGHAGDGSRVVDVAGVRATIITATRMTLGVPRLEASSTDAFVRKLAIKALPTASQPSPLLVGEWDPNEVTTNVRQRSVRQFSFDLLAEVDPLAWANRLGPYLPSGSGSTGGGSKVFTVAAIFCQDVTEADPPTSGGGNTGGGTTDSRDKINVSSAKNDGDAIAHNQNTTTPLLTVYTRLADGRYRIDPAITYKTTSNPAALLLNIPGGSWPGGLLVIDKP